MKVSSVEVKIVFNDADNIRVLRGVIDHEDNFFIYLKRNDGVFRIGKQFIVKIEGENNEK